MQPSNTIEYAIELTRKEPGSYDSWLKLAQAYLKVRLVKEAHAAASHATRIAPHIEEVWLYMAHLSIFMGDHSTAEDYYTQALVLFDVHKNKDAYIDTLKLRAYSRSLIGDYQGAIDDLLVYRKNHVMDRKTLDLYQYCTSMLEHL